MSTFKATVDKVGRIVIPAPIRERLGLAPGTELDVAVEDGSVRLTRNVAPPKLVRVHGRWVVRAQVPASERPSVDVASLVEAERDRWPV